MGRPTSSARLQQQQQEQCSGQPARGGRQGWPAATPPVAQLCRPHRPTTQQASGVQGEGHPAVPAAGAHEGVSAGRSSSASCPHQHLPLAGKCWASPPLALLAWHGWNSPQRQYQIPSSTCLPSNYPPKSLRACPPPRPFVCLPLWPVWLLLLQGEVSGTQAVIASALLVGSAVASTALWYYSKRYVGELAVLRDSKGRPTAARFSVLDFWGNREVSGGCGLELGSCFDFSVTSSFL